MRDNGYPSSCPLLSLVGNDMLFKVNLLLLTSIFRRFAFRDKFTGRDSNLLDDAKDEKGAVVVVTRTHHSVS